MFGVTSARSQRHGSHPSVYAISYAMHMLSNSRHPATCYAIRLFSYSVASHTTGTVYPESKVGSGLPIQSTSPSNPFLPCAFSSLHGSSDVLVLESSISQLGMLNRLRWQIDVSGRLLEQYRCCARVATPSARCRPRRLLFGAAVPRGMSLTPVAKTSILWSSSCFVHMIASRLL